MHVGFHSPALRLACILVLCLALVPSTAYGRLPESPPAASSQSVSVRITQPTPSVSSKGILRVGVEVTLSSPAEYLEVRLRFRQPSGKLVYQKTEVRSNAAPGPQIISYEYDLGPLALEQGRYPLEVRVLATGSDPTNAIGRVLVIDPATEALPVAIVVSAAGVPSVTADGRLAEDPAQHARLREDLAFITQLALDRRVPLALAIPPVLLEEFGRVAGGYETTAGVVVPASADIPVHTAQMLQSLQSTIATGSVEMVDVPYALPDLGRLSELHAEADLPLHWSRTDGVNATVLHSAAASSVAYMGATLTAAGVNSLKDRGVRCVLAPASTVRSKDTTAKPGAYTLTGGAAHVLVLDEKAARGAYQGSPEFYDALFDRLGDGPAVIMLEIGSNDANGTLAVQNALEWVQGASWLRLASINSLASGEPKREASLGQSGRRYGDSEYWTQVGRCREAAVAYNAAVGDQDVDALAVVRAALISESSLFERQQGVSYDGAAFARGVLDFVSAQFALVRLDAKDVTLSGTKGAVPLTLINDTGKSLKLTIRARSSTVLPGSPSQDVVAGPTQNFLTVPIDLGNTLSDALYVEVLAGDMRIAETTVQVHASYMDRLAVVLMVILVLGGLLLFIRRRALGTDAGTIVADDKHNPDRSSGE